MKNSPIRKHVLFMIPEEFVFLNYIICFFIALEGHWSAKVERSSNQMSLDLNGYDSLLLFLLTAALATTFVSVSGSKFQPDSREWTIRNKIVFYHFPILVLILIRNKWHCCYFKILATAPVSENLPINRKKLFLSAKHHCHTEIFNNASLPANQTDVEFKPSGSFLKPRWAAFTFGHLSCSVYSAASIVFFPL